MQIDDGETSAVAEAIGDQTAATVEAAIDTAQERQENAERTAEQIAEAAMESERGNRIERLEQEVRECRLKVEAQETSLSTLREKQAEQEGALATLLLTADQRLSTPPTLETPQEPTPEAEPVAVVENPEAEAEVPAPVADQVPARRKRMRFV